MSKAIITYYGHSCFKIEANGSTVIFDPYDNGSVPGLKLIEGIEADTVSCSHDHSDHNAAHLVKVTGKRLHFQLRKLAVPHDRHNGAHRGWSDITLIDLPDMTIAHLGDLGRLPTEREYAELDNADVVLLPCAGYFTIDSKEAAEVISHLKHPCLKILMHFREGNRGYDVQETIGEIMKDIKAVRRLDTCTVTVDAAAIPDETITLEPKQ